jgi:hypothetical protein
VVQGHVVDAVTGAGIAGASVHVLAPGATIQRATAQDIVAGAVTDGRGFFQTAPPVGRGARYSLIAAASGYTGTSGELAIPEGTAPVGTVGRIALQRSP